MSPWYYRVTFPDGSGTTVRREVGNYTHAAVSKSASGYRVVALATTDRGARRALARTGLDVYPLQGFTTDIRRLKGASTFRS